MKKATNKRSPAKEGGRGAQRPIRTVRAFVRLRSSEAEDVPDFMLEADSIAIRPDDAVYEKRRDVWEIQPRGLARIYVREEDAPDALTAAHDSASDVREGAAPETDMLADSRVRVIAASDGGPASESRTAAAARTPTRRSEAPEPQSGAHTATETETDGEYARPAGDAGEPASRAEPEPLRTDGTWRLVHTMCGLRKFGYDEDVCYGDPARVRHVVAVEKENGENAQISAFTLHRGGRVHRLWVIGSKNVPLIVRFGPDGIKDLALREYTAPRYGFAVEIARLFLSGTPVCVHDRVHVFLSETRCTMVAEAIFTTSQHLVAYGDNDLRAFALAPPYGTPSSAGLIASLPGTHTHTHALAHTLTDTHARLREMGVKTAHVLGEAALGSPEYAALCRDIGALENSEGAVMYGFDSDGVCARMWKHKAHAYTLARRARTAILSGLPNVALVKRLHALATIGVPEDTIARGVEYFTQFATWLRCQSEFHAAEGAGRSSVQSAWVTLNRRFVSERDSWVAPPLAAQSRGRKIVIMLQGLPLTGKSTLARQVTVLLLAAGAQPAWLNQDEIAGGGGKAGARPKYLAALKQLTDQTRVTHILLDKTNIDKRNRDDYYNLGLYPTVTVRMVHPDDTPGSMDHMIALCKERFALRGTRHRSLRAAADARTVLSNDTGSRHSKSMTIDGILESFASIDGASSLCSRSGDVMGDSLDDDDGSMGVVLQHDVTLPRAVALQRLWSSLSECSAVPDVALPDETFEEAIRISDEYENMLATNPPVTRFWGVALSLPERNKLWHALPTALPLSSRSRALLSVVFAAERAASGEGDGDRAEAGAWPDADGASPAREQETGLVLRRAVHHTLVYFGGVCDPATELAFAARLSEPMPVHVTALVWDDRACAAAVLPTTGSRNAFPHITIALSGSTEPVYSNALLERAAAAFPALAHTHGAGTPPDWTALSRGIVHEADGVRLFVLPEALELTGTIARNPA